MRRYHRICLCSLCAALFLCAACTPAAEIDPAPVSQPAAVPSPTPPPAAWEADPKQFILDVLDAAFSDDKLKVRIFLNNGSGPISLSMLDSECGQDIRDLFSAYDWEVTDWEATQRPEGVSAPSDSFCVDFCDPDVPYYFYFYTWSDVLWLVPADGADDTMERLYFTAPGAKNLSRDFTALCPQPAAQCALISFPVQETLEDNARRFMDELFAVMLENGHILEHELLALDTVDGAYMLFDVSFRIKAACPERNVWTSGYNGPLVDASGWTDTIKWRIWLTASAEEGICRLDWIE